MAAHARLTLAARFEGPLAKLTEGAPEGMVEGHFLGRSMLVRLAGEGTGARRLAEAFAGSGFAPAGDAAGLVFLPHREMPERALVDAVEAAGGIVLPPLRWRGGEVRLDALQVEGDLVAEVRRALPGVRLARKQPLDAPPAPAELLREGLALPSMTRKQAQAILAALDAGYYDMPRKVTTLDVARRLGVARSTFEEHLKRAEGQFVAALAPLARMRLAGEGEERAEALRLYARYSEALGLYVTLAVRSRGGSEAVAEVRMARAPEPGASAEHPWLARVLEQVATGKGDLGDIPVDLEVSPFERRVLDALRRIPPGTVLTYGELAKELGKPGAARAVGGACARNPAPLVIPCHRVVRGDGDLGGYSGAGGVATKAKLLAVEGARPKGKDRRRGALRTRG